MNEAPANEIPTSNTPPRTTPPGATPPDDSGSLLPSRRGATHDGDEAPARGTDPADAKGGGDATPSVEAPLSDGESLTGNERRAQLYGDPRPRDLRGVPMGTTRYTRTGLHVRANLGLGYLHVFDSSSANFGDQSEFSAENSAVSAVPLDLEVWIGGALMRDLALNLVLRSGQAAGGTLHASPEPIELEGGLTTAFVGAGLMYHLDPGRGWLVGLAAGFERWQASVAKGAAPQVGGSGVAASLYGGHDWWLGANTAFGVLTRLNVGVATGNGRAEVGQLQLENSDFDFYLQAGVAASLSYF